VEIVAGQNVGQMNQLSQAIDKLTLPSQLKRRKADALIPHIEHELSIVANDEDGEEEEG
jgi:hypothetical protein